VRRRNWKIRIQDILKAAEKIVAHTEALDQETFSADEWMIDAVLRNFTVIGEAARGIPDEIIAANPEIPWDEIRDMRNIIVHEYFGVDPSIIWKTITDDLPPLIQQLESALDKSS
jgi:uncharacterized protein with HEPN domain